MRSARLVAWLIRVFHRLTHPKLRAERSTSSKIELKLSPTPLSVSEVTEAEKRIVQRQSFHTDIDKSVITGRLKPFKEEGILRVEGRLKYSDLGKERKARKAPSY